MRPPPLSVLVEDEITSLHAFFTDWLNGSLPDDDRTFDAGFASRFHPAFELVDPAGGCSSLDALRTGLRGAHGRNSAFRIQVRNARLVVEQGLVVATYEEWQRGAGQWESPENGRLATAVFDESPRAPHGLRWVRVHETWLPREQVDADPFDF